MQFEKVKKEIINKQKESFCAKSYIMIQKKIFSPESKKCCQSKWKKLIKGLNNVTKYDIMLKDGDLQNLSKVDLM